MYVILINEDNSLYGSHKERIMKGSKLVDNLVFIVDPNYKGIDMTKASVLLEYVLPISKKYETINLVLSDKKYKDCFLQYKLPFDTNLTSEAGAVELQLTFAWVELDEKGNDIQRVRKTSPTKIEITPISAWSDIIPDSALSALDQRIIKTDAQIKALTDLANVLENGELTGIVDDLVYDDKEETLQLSSKGVGVGTKVSVRDMLDDGTPIVDLGGSDTEVKPDDGQHDDCNGVVEFD